MSPSSSRSFRVTVLTWSAHRAEVEAPDAETAETIAQDLWETDCDAFQHKDGGIDGFEVEELAAEAGR